MLARSSSSHPDRARLALAAFAVVALVAFAGRGCMRGAVAARVRHAAAARGLVATWRTLDLAPPLRVRLTGLALTRAAERDTVFRAESLAVIFDPWRLLALRPTPRAVLLSHARFVRPAPAAPDTLEDESPRRNTRPDRSARVRRLADGAVQALLLPARRLPRLTLRDVTLENAPSPDEPDAEPAALQLRSLDLWRHRGGVSLEAAGALAFNRAMPFRLALEWGDDDRLDGSARIGVPYAAGGRLDTLSLGVNGRLRQDRIAGTVGLTDSTRVLVGDIPIFLSARVARRGPALSLRLTADGLTEERLLGSLPRPLLGPLLDLAVLGSFDYRLAFDLDLARPDSVDFHADVVPHGLMLDLSRTRLDIARLERPFVATIHLPHGVREVRDLSVANPHFLPLGLIDSLLVHAVIANEDGAFFRHRGFNTEAVKLAIADNIHAAAYRRGAGTITMQLARNLWLGHERTLSRKGQEVVLAWVLEHLTGLTKDRLLEIYLNIIEWGPGVHGADEAAHYYFDHGAERVTLDEALFLTTLVPAPTRWRYRLERDGTLRTFERAQMRFIGRAMVTKGWLDPARLPPADSLRVGIRGAARDVLFPPDTSAGPAESAAMEEDTRSGR